MTKINELLSLLINMRLNEEEAEKTAEWFFNNGFKIDSENGFVYKLHTSYYDNGNEVEKGFIYRIDYKEAANVALRFRKTNILSKRILYLVQNPRTDEKELAEKWWEDLDYVVEKSLYEWWILCAGPIHYIVAGLIAEELEKEDL